MSWPENDFLHSALCIWILVTCLWGISVIKKTPASLTLLVDYYHGRRSCVRDSLQPDTGQTPVLSLGLDVGLETLGIFVSSGLEREEEDPRYQAFRKNYGAERYWWFSYFQVFCCRAS